MINKKYITIEEFKTNYDLKKENLDNSVKNNFFRDNDFIYFRDYNKIVNKVKIRDVVYIQNIKRCLFNYVQNLKKGDIIRFNKYMRDCKKQIIKINYKRNSLISSIKIENYLINPEDLYFKNILIKDFILNFMTFFSSTPSFDDYDLKKLKELEVLKNGK